MGDCQKMAAVLERGSLRYAHKATAGARRIWVDPYLHNTELVHDIHPYQPTYGTCAIGWLCLILATNSEKRQRISSPQ
jgi:hypothetical protein